MRQEAEFVGVRILLEDAQTWPLVVSAVRPMLALLTSHAKASVRMGLIFESVPERPGPAEEVSKELRGENLMNVMTDISNGRIAYMHGRSHRGEWDSLRNGYWLWASLGSPYVHGGPDPDASLFITYPSSKFKIDRPSEGTDSVLQLFQEIGRKVPLCYGYANLGRWDQHPGLRGSDGLYAQTARSIPVSAFDDYAGQSLSRYRTGVKGAFWLNVLNPHHIERLGGVEHLREEAQPHAISDLPHGRIAVLAVPSPLVTDTPGARDAFARLFRVFQPIFG